MRPHDFATEFAETTQGIWERVWYCSFSRSLTTSEEHYKYFGTPSTGFKNIDKMSRDDVVQTMITINDMVEMHRKGITVGVMNYDDCKLIYECIQRHLTAWKHYLQVAVNYTSDPPIEDLVELDRFANAVYSHAKYLIPKEQIDSVFIASLQGRMTFTRSSIAGLFDRKAPVEDQNPEELYPERQELGETFKRAVAGFGRWK